MNPKEVQLKFKFDDSGILSLLVDPIENAEYVWQFCRSGTALWNNLNGSDRNTFSAAVNIVSGHGDKYRCLIKKNGKVIAFSKVLTLGVHKYHGKEESSTQSGRQSQYGQRSSSVADTDGMDGWEFEQYCADVLKRNGFTDVSVTQGSGDYGVDILAKKDSVTYAVQCKCFSVPVGNKAVQEAFSGKSFYNCMVAAVLTNSYFTNAAKETAKRNSVILWDRDDLDKMIKNPGDPYREFEQQQREKARQERERWEQERRYQEQQRRERERQEQQSRQYNRQDSAPGFFNGCTTWEQVRERYKKLAQMYHPDHDSGDEDNMKEINAQYEALKKKFGQ